MPARQAPAAPRARAGEQMAPVARPTEPVVLDVPPAPGAEARTRLAMARAAARLIRWAAPVAPEARLPPLRPSPWPSRHSRSRSPHGVAGATDASTALRIQRHVEPSCGASPATAVW